jgi:hypothetical protein
LSPMARPLRSVALTRYLWVTISFFIISTFTWHGITNGVRLCNVFILTLLSLVLSLCPFSFCRQLQLLTTTMYGTYKTRRKASGRFRAADRPGAGPWHAFIHQKRVFCRCRSSSSLSLPSPMIVRWLVLLRTIRKDGVTGQPTCGPAFEGLKGWDICIVHMIHLTELGGCLAYLGIWVSCYYLPTWGIPSLHQEALQSNACVHTLSLEHLVQIPSCFWLLA